MNNRKLLIIGIIAVLLTGFISYNVGNTMGSRSLFKKPKVSLSGNHDLLEVYSLDVNNSRYVNFVVLSNVTIGNKKLKQIHLLEPFYFFYTRFNLYSSWGKDDTLWIVSGDIGIHCWSFIDERWVEINIDEKTLLLAPEDILKYWDEYYGNS